MSPEQPAVEALKQIEGIRPGVWQTLTLQEKLGVLCEVERCISVVQGRPSAEVIIDPEVRLGEFGSHNRLTNRIKISMYSLEHDNVEEIVDTVLHEGRHACQYHAVEHSGFHSNAAEVEA